MWSFLPRLTVLTVRAAIQCSSVSDGQCKSRLTHVTISLQLEEEVMSSGQLALICAAALFEKYRAKTGGWSQNSNLAELATVFISFGF